MKVYHVRLWLFLTCLIGLVGLFMAQRVYTAPQGDQRLYIPQVGRAEPVPVEFIGLTHSQSPPYPNTPMPISEIYTMRGDGSVITRLTTNELYDESPQWSPEGSLILWQQSAERLGTVGDYYSALWVMNTDGTDAREIFNQPGFERGYWSPDGSHIFVVSYDHMQYLIEDLYMTSPNSDIPTLIISDVDWDKVAWSPNSSYLAFIVQKPNHLYDIYRVNPDGSELTLLVEDADRFFDWSPDGAWLVYNKTVAGNQDVFLIRADGSETRRLTTDPTNETFSLWVENGERLLVQRRISQGVYVTDLVSVADGTTTIFLTETAGLLGVSPDGTTVAYTVLSGDMATVFLKSTDSSSALPISPELLCMNVCGIDTSGWSATGRYITYRLDRSITASQSYNRVYVASVEGSTPTYRLLMDENAYGAQWLPHSEWFSAYAPSSENNGYRLQLFHARSGVNLPLPLSDNGRTLVLSEWRYQP